VAAYHEIVLEGSLPVVRAFLMGLRLGKGWATPFLCSDDHGIHGDSRGHKALERIKLTKDLTYVVVIDRHVPVIAEAVRAAQKQLGIAIRRDRAVNDARFDFSFRIFDRKIATRLRQLLGKSSAELTVALTEDHEEVRPDSKGIEAYAPEHDYVFEGQGATRGALPAVLALCEDMRRIEQVTCEKIRLL